MNPVFFKLRAVAAILLICFSISACGIESVSSDAEILSDLDSSKSQTDMPTESNSKQDGLSQSSKTPSKTPQKPGASSSKPSSSSKPETVSFKDLDNLVSQIPMEYESYISEDDNDLIRDILHNINRLDRKKATKKEIEDYYSTLKQAVEEVSYKYNDIDAVHITYSKAPTKGGGYVKASIAVVDVSKSLTSVIEDFNSQVRVRGNSTADHDKKPYKIKFSKKTDLFGMGAAKSYCLLANAYDKTLIRNALAFELAHQLGLAYTPEYRFVDVFVNGEYRGNYILTEHVEASSARVDISPEAGEFLIEVSKDREGSELIFLKTKTLGCRFELNEPDPPTDAQLKQIEKKLNDIDAAIASTNFERIKSVLDVDSFVNFAIVNEYMKMTDFDQASPRFYYKNDKLYAGPVWDFDLSSGNAHPRIHPEYCNNISSEDSYRGDWIIRHNWFKTLLDCKEFKNAYAARYRSVQAIITNMYEKNFKGESLIDRIMGKYSPSFNRNYSAAGWEFKRVWLDMEPFPTHEGNIEYLRTWLRNRNQWMLENL